MELTFIRKRESRYASTALRDDRVTVCIPGYDRARPLPHDLAHYVVERELRLQRGFWGSVASGAVFPGMEVVSGRQRPHAAERSATVLRANRDDLTQAEVLVGTFIEIVRLGLDADRTAASARLANAWSPAHRPPAGDRGCISATCAALREAESKWAQTATDGSLTVMWRPGHAAPRRAPGRGRCR